MDDTVDRPRDGNQVEMKRDKLGNVFKESRKEEDKKGGLKPPSPKKNPFLFNIWYFIGFFLLISLVNG